MSLILAAESRRKQHDILVGGHQDLGTSIASRPSVPFLDIFCQWGGKACVAVLPADLMDSTDRFCPKLIHWWEYAICQIGIVFERNIMSLIRRFPHFCLCPTKQALFFNSYLLREGTELVEINLPISSQELPAAERVCDRVFPTWGIARLVE